MSMLGGVAGPHRFWAHRPYKATLPLKIFLACKSMISNQVSILFTKYADR